MKTEDFISSTATYPVIKVTNRWVQTMKVHLRQSREMRQGCKYQLINTLLSHLAVLCLCVCACALVWLPLRSTGHYCNEQLSPQVSCHRLHKNGKKLYCSAGLLSCGSLSAWLSDGNKQEWFLWQEEKKHVYLQVCLSFQFKLLVFLPKWEWWL